MRNLLFLFCLVFAVPCFSQKGRIEKDISKAGWKLWLDTSATWTNDQLYAPPVDLKKLPAFAPTIGWNEMYRLKALSVQLPATVEQFYWGKNGNPFGVAGNYLGVSWFYTECLIPSSYRGKKIVLNFESARFRAEVFVNEKLCGYDLVTGTPFDVDITPYVQYGKQNKIAIRITDPNGNFDWRDSQNFMWGNYRTNPTHGFGGITGKVKLIATDEVSIKDVFVKNKPVVNEIDLAVTFQNEGKEIEQGKVIIEIKEKKTGLRIFQTRPTFNAQPGENQFLQTIRVENPKLWSVDEPNLYIVTVKWENASSTDEVNKQFGFRWFEVKDVNGDRQFYLNANESFCVRQFHGVSGRSMELRLQIHWRRNK